MIKGDWVTSFRGEPYGLGQIQRVSKKQGWADVQWLDTTKRMKLADLKLITIIDIVPTEKALLKTSQC